MRTQSQQRHMSKRRELILASPLAHPFPHQEINTPSTKPSSIVWQYQQCLSSYPTLPSDTRQLGLLKSLASPSPWLASKLSS